MIKKFNLINFSGSELKNLYIPDNLNIFSCEYGLTQFSEVGENILIELICDVVNKNAKTLSCLCINIPGVFIYYKSRLDCYMILEISNDSFVNSISLIKSLKYLQIQNPSITYNSKYWNINSFSQHAIIHNIFESKYRIRNTIELKSNKYLEFMKYNEYIHNEAVKIIIIIIHAGSIKNSLFFNFPDEINRILFYFLS